MDRGVQDLSCTGRDDDISLSACCVARTPRNAHAFLVGSTMRRILLLMFIVSVVCSTRPARAQGPVYAPDFESRPCTMDPGCCDYDGVGDEVRRRVQRDALDADHDLLLLQRGTFGYNQEWSAFVL